MSCLIVQNNDSVVQFWAFEMVGQEVSSRIFNWTTSLNIIFTECKEHSFIKFKTNHSLLPDECFQVYKSFIWVYKINQWVQYILEWCFAWDNFSSIKTNVYITTNWTTDTLGGALRPSFCFTQNFRWWSGKRKKYAKKLSILRLT